MYHSECFCCIKTVSFVIISFDLLNPLFTYIFKVQEQAVLFVNLTIDKYS
jgi:hypothetical protein